MNYLWLKKFLSLHNKANVVIFNSNQLWELISYNGCYSVPKYEDFLEEQRNTTFYAYLKYIENRKQNFDQIQQVLYSHFSEYLSMFHVVDKLNVHKKINIQNRTDKQYNYSDLPMNLKKSIDQFVSVQKHSLMDFTLKIKPRNNSGVKWDSTQTNMVELANLLVEGNFVVGENFEVSKKELIQRVANLFGVNIQFPEKVLNKLISRDNPKLFLDILNECSEKYITKLDNKKRLNN